MTLESVTEHGLVGDVLRSRVEARRHFFQRLFPPIGNEPPAHRHKFVAASFGRLHDLNGISWRNVVVRLQIPGSAC
jgi:hypothetical protein